MPAEIIYKGNENPEITIVIPSLDGQRDGNVDKLVEQLKAQTFKSIEIIVSLNERPNGHARNVGIAIASPSSRFYAFFDDDVKLGTEAVLSNFMEVLSRSNIGLVGASQLPPNSSTWKQRWIGYDLGKAKFPIQEHIVDTEMATHAGMACRREVWKEMGGESDVLVTGTDTDLRERLRKVGYRVVVAPQTWVYHPLPDKFRKVLKSAMHNGWYQLDYRMIHGFQKGYLKPFRKVDSKIALIIGLLSETMIFLPHIFITNRRPMLGFRPLNAAFRFLMVATYRLRAYRERASYR